MKVESDIALLEKKFLAKTNDQAFANLDSLQKKEPNQYLYIEESDDKIFKNFWGNLITIKDASYEIRPMRYDLMENGSDKSAPSQYVLSREDITSKFSRSLNKFRAVIPIKGFHLMISSGQNMGFKEYKSQSPSFYAPCIYDNWISDDKSVIIQSFALILDDKQMPFALGQKDAESWLSKNLNIEQLSPSKYLEL